MQFLEGKPGEKIKWSLRSEFLERFSANKSALSDAEGNPHWVII